MFESLLIRRLNEADSGVDIGEIAEALVFYGSVHVHFDRGSIVSLSRAIGHENVLHLLRSGRIRGTYIPQSQGTHTTPVSGIEIHQFVSFEPKGREEKGKQNRREVLEDFLLRTLEGGYGVRKFIKNFCELVPTRGASERAFGGGVYTRALEDLHDDKYSLFAIEKCIQKFLPNFVLPPHWHFRPISQKDGFFVETNFDFKFLNETLKRERPGFDGAITAALCADIVFQARSELEIVSGYGCDVMTSPLLSSVLCRKFETIIRSRTAAATEIEMFQDVTLGSARAIGDAISSQQRSFEELLKLLDQADKFRDWIRGSNPDLGLLTEYLRAVEKDTWVEKLPTKSSRFAFFTGGGLLADLLVPSGLGTLVGAGLGAVDSFVFDRLIRGWKPNQFIDRRLKPFVEK